LRARADVRLACRATISGPVTVLPLSALTSAGAGACEGAAAAAGGLVAAVDLGTTTVAAAAVEASGGREVRRAFGANRQQAWGADVLSRLSAALAGAGDDLRGAALESVGGVLAAALEGVRADRVVIAGNTAMAALLAGVDVSSLATHPFAPPPLPSVVVGAGLPDALANTDVHLVPPIAGFVGGDALCGLVHTGTLYAEEPVLFVDLGTNAEIALATSSGLWVASAAAGPAFEGVGIECGGPVGPGSVTSVDLDGGAIRTTTAGSAQATSLSGAGVVSVLSLLRGAGHLDADGLLVKRGPLSDSVFTGSDGVVRVALGDRELTISQRDVRTVQLAKAAVRVGVDAVMAAAGVPASELTRVHVAGAFGEALNADDLIAIGLLPAQARPVVEAVGNASLGGALAMALDTALIAESAERAAGARHVDLALDPGFNDSLLNALSIEPR
jgi:uncharacterized 2Fe-2S/4Fe-4S cluster protein (DUF4445 family)